MAEKDDFIELRRKLLIPATFGVHSVVEGQLRDYISRTFGHSTFAFYEAFLDRPVQWWEDVEYVKQDDIGTTEPFLSRFVYQSGLTPKINKPVLRSFKSRLDEIQKDSNPTDKKTKIEALKAELLQIPLVATSHDSYHSDLEKLAFSLNDSIILSGLLRIWLTIERDGEFRVHPRPQIRRSKREEWKDVEEWKTGAFNAPPYSLNYPKNESTRPVPVIGRLDPDRIKKFYGDHLMAHLEKASAYRNDEKGTKEDNDPEIRKALDLLREYQIALRPWIAAESMPTWAGVSISSDALFWGQCVVLLPGNDKHFCNGEIREDARQDYEGIAKILIENVRRTYLPIMTIFETYLLEHRLKDRLRKEREEWLGSEKLQKLQAMRTQKNAQGSIEPDESGSEFLGLKERWTKWAERRANVEALTNVGMGHAPAAIASELTANVKADGDHLFMSLLYRCFENVDALTGRAKIAVGELPADNQTHAASETATKTKTVVDGEAIGDGAVNGAAAAATNVAAERSQTPANNASDAVPGPVDPGLSDPSFSTDDKNNSWTIHLNELERSLASLWAARFSLAFNEQPRHPAEINRFLATLKKIEDSLVFEKYLISSPAILKAIMTAVGLRHGDRGKGRASIKTSLVVGGPGSGKDSMAKLVRLFSPGYRFGELITLNMASFRPKEAAVPILLGLDIFDNSKGSSVKSFSIASLLGRAWKSRGSNMADPPFQHGKGLAFIFDELNSLDMDTQGALLRFLESSELLSLGDFEQKIENVDALIVGVMNEDPSSITKARTLDRVLRDKQVFGGMLGDYLYELFRGQRRLRDDLYFRMARGGEIVLPELRDRREDIPILFYFILTKDLMESFDEERKKELNIELSTYEQLMDRSLQWEGNVRELQALAREIFKVASDDQNNKKRRGEESRLTFRGSHVHMARQNLLHKSQPGSDTIV